MVPDGWRVKKFSDVAVLKSGGTPSKDNPDYWAGDLPWISAASMHDVFVYDSDLRITEEGLAKGSRRAKKDSILLLVRGSMLWKHIPVCLTKRDVAFNQDVKNIVTNNKVTTSFLFYNLKSQENRLLHLVVGTGIGAGKLDTDDLSSLKIYTPPIPEQKKIAAILSTWDEAISANEDLLTNSRLRKKALMQQLLTGKKRLPGFSGEWRLAPIGSLFVERNETGADEMPLIGIGEIGIYLASDSGRKDNSSSDKGKYKVIRPGDIGYNTMRMWQGRCGLSSLTGIVSPAYTVITPTKSAEATFFFYLFKTPEYIHKFYSSSQGLVSDTWSLKYKEFSKIKVLSPEVNEQKAISDILTTADDEIEALEQRINNLKLQKKALMQQLLTGKKRVMVEPVTA